MSLLPICLEDPLEALTPHPDAFGIPAGEAGLRIDAFPTDRRHLELSHISTALLQLPHLHQDVLHPHSEPVKFRLNHE